MPWSIPSIQVEYLFQDEEALVGPLAVQPFEVGLHRLLPARVDIPRLHFRQGPVEVLRLQVAEECAVVSGEQRVVRPSRLAQRLLHLRPDVLVRPLILLQAILADLQNETDSLHIDAPIRVVLRGLGLDLAETWIARIGPEEVVRIDRLP